MAPRTYLNYYLTILCYAFIHNTYKLSLFVSFLHITTGYIYYESAESDIGFYPEKINDFQVICGNPEIQAGMQEQ